MIPNRKKYIDEHTEIRRRKWREYSAKNREKDKPYFIEVNSTPGLIGIEEAWKSKYSITEAILKNLKSLKLSNKS